MDLRDVRDRLGGEDKGQLMLVGAVALAVALIAVAILFNSVLYNASISPQAASAGTASAESYGATVERDLQELVNRVADGEDYLTASQVSELRAALPGYSRRLAIASTDSGGRYLNVTYDATSEQTGTGYVQSTDSALPNGVSMGSNSSVVQDVTELHGFDMNVTTVPEDEPVLVVAKDKTASPTRFWRLRLREDAGGDYVVKLRTTGDGSATEICRMTAATTSEVRFVLVEDSMRIEPCGASVPFATGVPTPYDLYLDKGQTNPTGRGVYSIVARGTDTAGNPSPISPDPLVEVGFDVTYEDPAVSTRSSVTVEVGEHPAPESGGTLVYENFENGSFDSEWTTTATAPSLVDIGVDGQAHNTGAYAAYADGVATSSGEEGRIELDSSAALNTTTFDAVVVEYWAQEGLPSQNGPEANEGENLSVQYLDDTGVWRELDRVDASSAPEKTYDRSVEVTSQDAFHDDFRIRFVAPSDQNSDRWYIDDVRILGRYDTNR